MTSLFLYGERDSKPEGARSVKQNSLNNCFVAEWCDGGYCEQCGAVGKTESAEYPVKIIFAQQNPFQRANSLSHCLAFI